QDTTTPTASVSGLLDGWLLAYGIAGPGSATATAPGNGPYPLRLGGVPNDTLDWRLFDNTCLGKRANGPVITLPLFLDGRRNKWEPWETAAIYCLGDGSVRVYVIGQPQWFIAFDASPGEIARVSKHPVRNTVIKTGHGAGLVRLQNGMLLVSTAGLNPK